MDNDILKILLVTSEASPYIKSGGLGDVAASLPKELRRRGVDVRICLPKYKDINYGLINNLKHLIDFRVNLGWRDLDASVYTFDDGVKYYLIDNGYYFNRDGLYGYGDDLERFSFFTKAALELLFAIDFKPNVVHFNDWQTGLGPIYLNDIYRQFSFYSEIKSLYTIHNLQYQGTFPRGILKDIGLNDGYYTSGKLEFYGNINCMKGGILYADKVSTVSETYSKEIQTPAYSYGLHGVLLERSGDLCGIINGIDNDENDPAADNRIYYNFDSDNISGKYRNRAALREELGLSIGDMPMIAMISRMADQKGFDLISIAMEELMHKDVQVVVLGTGEARYENMFKHYGFRFKDKLSANIKFDSVLAQKIYASSDIFLMPSLFEPCGLSQMLAMRYGTVPVVRRTGGLNDTVSHYDYNTGKGNGFVFNDYDAYGMMWALNEALHAYYNEPEHWGNIVKNCMAEDFSWPKSAERYISLYEQMCSITAGKFE